MINYGFTKEIDTSFEDTVTNVSIEKKLKKVFDSIGTPIERVTVAAAVN